MLFAAHNSTSKPLYKTDLAGKTDAYRSRVLFIFHRTISKASSIGFIFGRWSEAIEANEQAVWAIVQQHLTLIYAFKTNFVLRQTLCGDEVDTCLGSHHIDILDTIFAADNRKLTPLKLTCTNVSTVGVENRCLCHHRTRSTCSFKRIKLGAKNWFNMKLFTYP